MNHGDSILQLLEHVVERRLYLKPNFMLQF